MYQNDHFFIESARYTQNMIISGKMGFGKFKMAFKSKKLSGEHISSAISLHRSACLPLVAKEAAG